MDDRNSRIFVSDAERVTLGIVLFAVGGCLLVALLGHIAFGRDAVLLALGVE